MPRTFFRKILNLSNKSEYNNYKKIADEINSVKFDSLSNEKLLYKSNELRKKVSQGVSGDETIIEAFVLVKEDY
ncbi:hypothetical protein LL033_01755 [Clostridium estertheticum]|uniref:hypothetical protein n=1 Tax=Clostridium estertheticum TaxID=238834 RepID=UPI001C0D642C|nr:hypothetical protein [Clostridium estertheticum]MBU3216023.1 hypothetical protein [Clostridium estertheticum]WAG55989.1 hypothetical protein LL033_01755 [Clostridium estertheticum]